MSEVKTKTKNKNKNRIELLAIVLVLSILVNAQTAFGDGGKHTAKTLNAAGEGHSKA